MKYYLSVDCGGTKTAFLLTDEYGRVTGGAVKAGITYSAMEKESIYEILKAGAFEVTEENNISPGQLKYTVWGISCFGEYGEFDHFLLRRLPKLFPCECYLCNDVEIALAGSFLLGCGIHIIAGTGAIVMGRNEYGETARANGWHESFSDEGSAYWLGMKALSLFAKQADGRRKKDILYQLFCEYFNLKKDMDILSYYKNHLAGKRDKAAALQKILLEAAKKGDSGAVRLYEEAAEELTESVIAVAGQLGMKQAGIHVSCYGGLFRAGEVIQRPLREQLKAHDYLLVPPELSPLSGGILLAANKCGSSRENIVIDHLKEYEHLKEYQHYFCRY